MRGSRSGVSRVRHRPRAERAASDATTPLCGGRPGPEAPRGRHAADRDLQLGRLARAPAALLLGLAAPVAPDPEKDFPLPFRGRARAGRTMKKRARVRGGKQLYA